MLNHATKDSECIKLKWSSTVERDRDLRVGAARGLRVTERREELHLHPLELCRRCRRHRVSRCHVRGAAACTPPLAPPTDGDGCVYTVDEYFYLQLRCSS